MHAQHLIRFVRMPKIVRFEVWRYVRTITTAALVACVASCATQGVEGGPATVRRQFIAGFVELSCSLKCSGRWGENRLALLNLYQRGNWEMLAERVMPIGYNHDLAWFYLASAADELTYHDAAEQYYRKALTCPYRCDRFINVCDGFMIAREAQFRLQRLLLIKHQQPPAGTKFEGQG